MSGPLRNSGAQGAHDSADIRLAGPGQADFQHPDYDARSRKELPVITVSGFADFSDRDLQAALLGAMKMMAAMVAVALPVVWAVGRWQSAALFVIGAAIAATGLWEWRTLVAAISERLEVNPAQTPRPVAGVVVRLALRFLFAAGAMYVSLRWLNGSVYALLLGLSTAVVAVTFQAARLLRRWM